MKVETKRQFSMAFKVNAVQKSIDSVETVSAIAGKLGIHPKLLSKWRTQLTRRSKQPKLKVSNKGPDKSHVELERENKQLKKQLDKLQLEHEILKKAEEYFAKNLK